MHQSVQRMGLFPLFGKPLVSALDANNFINLTLISYRLVFVKDLSIYSM
jgi:hypothetical protein